MRSKDEIEAVIDDVERRLLAKREETGLELHVPPGGYAQVDEKWLSILVSPTGISVRASLYAEVLGEVNEDLRAAGVSNVILMPAVDW